VNRYLLDTTVISELRRPKPHGAVVAWIEGLDGRQIFLSAVTLGELQAGIERTRKQNPPKAEEIEVWVDRLAGSFQVLPMDGACFREWARLMHGQADDLLEDGMIAATATAHIHDLTVATRNTRDFRRLGVRVFDPFRRDL
jgi:predicted nucleic acid-binding protein